MIKILLKDIGKKFDRQWVIRSLSHEFGENESWAITGKNGSGKSTLLKIISGAMLPGKGAVNYFLKGKSVEPEAMHQYVSLAAPYTELIEEFTLEELITFHSKFKPFHKDISCAAVPEIMQLEKHRYKPLKGFSSGMKQRVKLGLAILSDTSLLLLDEPVSNLDQESVSWYNMLISKYLKDRTVLVFSNSKQEEYTFCQHFLELKR